MCDDVSVKIRVPLQNIRNVSDWDTPISTHLLKKKRGHCDERKWNYGRPKFVDRTSGEGHTGLGRRARGR